MHVFFDALVIMGGALTCLLSAALLLLLVFILLLRAVVPFEEFVTNPIRRALDRRKRLGEVVSSGWFIICCLGGLFYGPCLIRAAFTDPSQPLPGLFIGFGLCGLSATGVLLGYLSRN